jgi:hypothetical protein
MNRRQFLFVLLAVVIIGGAGLVLLNRNRQSWTAREAKMGDKALSNFRFNDVAAIHIVGGGSELNVARKDGVWRVQERGNYPANYPQIKDLLMRIKDLKVLQSERIGPSQLGRVNLGEPEKGPGSGTLLEFKDSRGAVLGSLLVGKRHVRPLTASDPLNLHGLFDGCYVLLPADPENVLLISDELASVVPEPGAWLSKEFFKAQNIKSISLVSTDESKTWAIARETESSPWILADSKAGETLNTAMASDMAETIGFLSFVDVSGGAASRPNRDSEKPMQLQLATFDRFNYVLQISPKIEGTYRVTGTVVANIPAQRMAESRETPEERKELNEEFQAKTKRLREKLAREQALASWEYVVEPQVLDQIMRTRAELLEKKTTILSERATVPDKDPLSLSR